MRPPNKAHAAWRKRLTLENVRACYLRARQRQITARLAQGRKQLELPLLDLKEAS